MASKTNKTKRKSSIRAEAIEKLKAISGGKVVGHLS
jgi:hypothetical protein